MKQKENLALTNPNNAWVVDELEKLYNEWLSWRQEVDKIVDQPYNHQTQLDVYADGEEMMLRHKVLQAKTLTFLNNNIQGHGFIYGMDNSQIDSTTSRLRIRVQHRINDLEILRACLQYAKVPESYWKLKGKELVEHLATKTGDTAIEIAASYLKNPMSLGKA